MGSYTHFKTFIQQTDSSLDFFCANSAVLLLIILHTGQIRPTNLKKQNKCASEQSNTDERGVFGSVMGGAGWWRRGANYRAGGVMSQS